MQLSHFSKNHHNLYVITNFTTIKADRDKKKIKSRKKIRKYLHFQFTTWNQWTIQSFFSFSRKTIKEKCFVDESFVFTNCLHSKGNQNVDQRTIHQTVEEKKKKNLGLL